MGRFDGTFEYWNSDHILGATWDACVVRMGMGVRLRDYGGKSHRAQIVLTLTSN